jgi:hypothetical protein
VLVPVGAVEDVGGLASVLSCRVSSLRLKYLGLPLGASFKAKSIWNGITKKMERCLAGWKWLYLSKGGKITLIKALCPIFLPIFCPLYPSVLELLTVLRNFHGISCGA